MSPNAAASIVLAADVGGTKTRFGLFRVEDDVLVPLRDERVLSAHDVSFAEVMTRFIAGDGTMRPAAACFAVAGPVVDQRVAMTNHPWILDAGELSRAAAGIPVRIVNDLEGTAVAMPFLPPAKLAAINPAPVPWPRGNVAVVAPGTGLGCAALYWDGSRHYAIASEGGHADFAPRNEREIALWRYLHDRHDHVSWERILSGVGIVTVYEFLRDVEHMAESPAVKADLAAVSDDAAAPARVSHAALVENDPLALAALDLFASVLGAKAGNLALEVLALGGVFIGGGIPPKILPALTRGSLREAFLAKGRQRDLLARMPLHVALEDEAALFGAARIAASALR